MDIIIDKTEACDDRQSMRMIAGFSMIELLITVVIIGVVSSMAMTTYFGTLERGRWSHARETVLGIAHAEEIYMALNGEYYGAGILINITACDDAAPMTFLSCRNAWENNLYFDDPNRYPSANSDVLFSVAVTGVNDEFFSANAVRQSGAYAGNFMRIDQSKNWAGAWGDPVNNIPP